EGLITISDSSDEELPLLQEMPAEQQCEEDDDDVVILAEDENMNFALQQPGPSELNGPRFEPMSNQEPGPSLLPTKKTSPPPVNREILSQENADLPPQQEEKVEARGQQGEDLEPEQNLGGAPAAATTDREIREDNQLDHLHFQPLEGEPHAVVNGCAPQQGQPEAEPGSLRAYGEEAPGPAFPRPEPQQDGIPGPASPQPAHPPEETGQQAAIDNEQPGPAFPTQGSHEFGSSNVPEQDAAGQALDLTALLIRETVSIPRACLPSVCMLFSDRFFKVCSVSHAH
uniref:Ring finger protein 216 n=1 Tax=Strix occidentalis caurina TaxID=311401 RepID=A0A8D0FH74_STROC